MSVEVLKQIWPEWSVGKRIGGGAYGTVYEASRNEYGVENHAAIKIIPIPASEAEIDVLRSEGLNMQAIKTHFQAIVKDFVNEIRLMVSLEGRSNIVNVKDYKIVEKKGEFGWYIFILMELLTPFTVYANNHQMTEAEVIKLGCDICTALETCAKEKIIHRDIKPGNILVHKSGDFKLGDFGIARKLENMTGGLSQRCTPKYMAPETAVSMHYDEQTDIYSLGIVLYELLNGRRIPFQQNKQIHSPADIENAVRRRNTGEAFPPPSDASPAMAALILRACAYNHDMRFASAAEMKQALISVANGTYQIGADSLDRTLPVRKTANSYDRTVSVRKVPAASNQTPEPDANPLVSAPEKSKTPLMTGALLAIVLLAGVGMFAVSKLTDRNDSPAPVNIASETTAETTEPPKFDEEQIDAIISEADALAAEGDYEGALVKVQNGLEAHPEAAELQDREDEYTKALNAQVKADILDEASTFADSGDYVPAITLLRNALENQGSDADYQTALNTYSNTYKSEIISIADSLAANGDYTGAIAKISEAEPILGEDIDLRNKSQTYEDEYVNGIVMQVDVYIEANDYDMASAAVDEALKVFPDNEILIERSDILKKSGQKSLLSVCPPYQTAGYYTEKTYSMTGNVYTNGFHLDDNNGGVAYFNLNQEYSLLSFDIGHRDGKNLKTGCYYFYLDGELVQTLTLEPSMMVQHVDIPVEGVSQLIIEGGYWCHCYALVNAALTPDLLSVPAESSQSSESSGEYILNACPPYQTEGYYTEKSYSLAGDNYMNGFHLNDDWGGVAYYNLDGKYNTLSFDVGHIDGKKLKTGYYYFYLDGELVHTLELNPSMMVQHVEIPLNGAVQMIIEGGSWCHCFALVNVKVSE